MPSLSFDFIEKDFARADHLRQVLREKFPSLQENITHEVHNGEFAEVMESILDEFDAQNQTLAPTFTFVDPFGYAGFPLKLIARLIAPSASEVLITFMASRVTRFLDEFHENALDALFGTTEWRSARDLAGEQRVQFLLRMYTRRLRESTPARHVLTFEMVGRDGNPIYWLIFATKHYRGCEAMKEAMYRVDPTGSYRFYDSAAGVRRFLLDENDQNWAKEAQNLIWEKFRGKSVSVEKVEKFVAPTVFLWRKKKLLVPLEEGGRIIRVDGRIRRLTYPQGCVITFSD